MIRSRRAEGMDKRSTVFPPLVQSICFLPLLYVPGAFLTIEPLPRLKVRGRVVRIPTLSPLFVPLFWWIVTTFIPLSPKASSFTWKFFHSSWALYRALLPLGMRSSTLLQLTPAKAVASTVGAEELSMRRVVRAVQFSKASALTSLRPLPSHTSLRALHWANIPLASFVKS